MSYMLSGTLSGLTVVTDVYIIFVIRQMHNIILESNAEIMLQLMIIKAMFTYQ